jgi:hypothetical protein
MISSRDILWTIVFPAVVAIAAMLASHFPWRRDAKSHAWGIALALCGAFAVAYIGTSGRPKFPPVEAQGWLVYLGIVVVLIAIASTWLRWPVAVASIVIVAVMAWLIARPTARSLEPSVFWTGVAATAAVTIVWWALMERLASRRPGGGLPLLMMMWAGAAALTVINAHSASLGLVAGTIAVVLGVIGVIGLWLRKVSLSRGGMLALAVLVLGIMLAGHFFADLTRFELILLAVAPLAMWIAEIPPLRRYAGVRFCVSLIALLAVLSIPLVPALKGLRETMKEQSESYSY